MEPYKIKSVEMLKTTSIEERKMILMKAGYNLFKIASEDVLIDLLTDSGTAAMSSRQWGALMQGDESYAGASSFFKFKNAVQQVTNHIHVIPTHQGRAAERVLFSAIGAEGKVFASNSFFDTTRGNLEYMGGEALDLLTPEALKTSVYSSFKGNMDVPALKKLIKKRGPENIPAVVLTVTNNTAGGQPVSMENIREVSTICKNNKIFLFLDACRFAENAFFIQSREMGYGKKSILKICREMFSLVDGSTMSAKKDGLANMGGWITLNCDKLADKCQNLSILTEGFPTYGGMSGRDMECVAQGLKEVVDQRYLEHRIKTVELLGGKLSELGIPIVEPPGGHAIYVDAKRFAPHIPQHQFPGQALACQLYVEGGIRTCEIGSVMFGKEDAQGNLVPHSTELIRLAIPRRVYTSSHMDYIVEVLEHLFKNRIHIQGLDMVHKPPFLRHFTATFTLSNKGASCSL